MIDPATLAAYEDGAATYAARATAPATDRAATLLARRLDGPGGPGGPVVDVGCGTGRDLGVLGPAVVGIDPSPAMLARARADHPEVALVRAAAGALPLRPGSGGAGWASKSLQHVADVDLPLALADVHRCLSVGAPLSLRLFTGDGTVTTGGDDDLPGRRFTLWAPEAVADLALGAGFADVSTRVAPGHDLDLLDVEATRARTLPDTVGPGMRLLVCGLNPSLHAADAGVGFAGPSNRFWPAMAAAGLLPPGTDRDPWRLLRDARIGMTDLVKRATPRAAELRAAEHRAGVVRLERLCRLLRPGAVVVVGLAGWRAAVDRRAVPGWQPRALGPSPVHLMPSTSGLNAATSLDTLTDHLRRAAGT